jgi:hypothetical protein
VLKRSRKTARSIRSRALLSVAQSFFVAQSNLSAPKFRQILKNAFDFRKEKRAAAQSVLKRGIDAATRTDKGIFGDLGARADELVAAVKGA